MPVHCGPVHCIPLHNCVDAQESTTAFQGQSVEIEYKAQKQLAGVHADDSKFSTIRDAPKKGRTRSHSLCGEGPNLVLRIFGSHQRPIENPFLLVVTIQLAVYTT